MTKQQATKQPQCEIEGCTRLVPANSPKDAGGNPLPLCREHADMLKVVLWGLTHIRAPQQQRTPQQQSKQPKIFLPGDIIRGN